MAKLKIVKKKSSKKKTSKKPTPGPIHSPEQMKKKIEEYFKGGYNMRKVWIHGKQYEMPMITITGLVLHLGFCSRQSFYDYEKKAEYAYIIKRARTLIEQEYEEQLQAGNVTGAIFALKNFGWTDKQELEHTGNPEKPIETVNLSKDDYIKIRKQMLKDDDV